jgi:hypothetical protein
MRHEEGDEEVKVKDCVILLASGTRKKDLPYVAKVNSLWENPDDGETNPLPSPGGITIFSVASQPSVVLVLQRWAGIPSRHYTFRPVLARNHFGLSCCKNFIILQPCMWKLAS